ncbi:ATP-dependent RecD-like DNA helicase [uncultured Limosilactobacillus sp.]|uniref:SF1B family DNA helicase RecD2 n=1 Tax=uncultured Limosilactobacillus sp. TaxID=2837629 RepID=UPI0025E8016C|nr:ATP-dependent RecD-like DNA helicase [uncultured Limosilactobacillus sp.]
MTKQKKTTAGQETVTGKPQEPFFSSPDSYYKVMPLITKKHTYTIVGDFGDLSHDVDYAFTGKWVKHPKYGQQFRVVSYKRVIDVKPGKDTAFQYLRNLNVDDHFAKTIVETLGDNALNELVNNPEIIERCDPTDEQRKQLFGALRLGKTKDILLQRLGQLGFTGNQSQDIFQKFGTNASKVIKEDPYQLVREVSGVTFSLVDKLADQLGWQADSPLRLDAGLLEASEELTRESGNTYCERQEVIDRASRLLGNRQLAGKLEQRLDRKKLQLVRVVDQQKVFPAELDRAEQEIARDLKLLNEGSLNSLADQDLEKQIKHYEDHNDIHLDDEQRAAIKLAVQSPVSLITGGPGTGKTTIIKGIIETFLGSTGAQTTDLVLAAPTGRAAKRMSEATGINAYTIHHCLGLTGREMPAQIRASKTFDAKMVIVDEMSMVDTLLCRALIDAVNPGTRLVLVGDADQLPSVGPGQVFSDLLSSAVLPTVKLERIYRQDEDSTIVTFAHQVNHGHLPDNWQHNQVDRSAVLCPPNQVAIFVNKLIDWAKQQGYDLPDIQVMAPMYKKVGGINEINAFVQSQQNPQAGGKASVVFGRENNHTYRVGDKVMQRVNNPDKGVFNGDIGIIKTIESRDVDPVARGKNAKITVSFDQREVSYNPLEWKEQLTLAYCISIHKSQGSQFPVVIIALVNADSIMLKRNLFYTAVTRASQFLLMVGEQQAFETSVINAVSARRTLMRERLTAAFRQGSQKKILLKRQSSSKTQPEKQAPTQSHGQSHVLTAAAIANEEISPMIGMEGITPVSFKKKE